MCTAAEELAAYLAANPNPDFSVIDRLWAQIEEQDEEEQANATAA